jgi:hypothetical protein
MDMWTVELGGDRYENVPQDQVMIVADQLNKKHGGVPVVARQTVASVAAVVTAAGGPKVEEPAFEDDALAV